MFTPNGTMKIQVYPTEGNIILENGSNKKTIPGIYCSRFSNIGKTGLLNLHCYLNHKRKNYLNAFFH